MKSLFIHPSPSLTKLLALIAGALLLMVMDHQYRQLEALRAVLSVAVYPLQVMVNAPVQAVHGLMASVATRQALVDENEKLRVQNLLLKTRLQKFSALESENKHLRELLDSSVELGEKVLVADVLGAQAEAEAAQLTLNKGSQHGVYLGQPLVDAEGVMGQVIHVAPFTSVAMLITHPNHALPVQFNRTGVRAVAVGTGNDAVLELNYVPVTADVRVGDLITTSGLGGRFPAGYPVGEVTKVSRESGSPFARISAAPSARLGRSQQVLLVWPATGPAAVAGLPGSPFFVP